jgi:hypothetical protein
VPNGEQCQQVHPGIPAAKPFAFNAIKLSSMWPPVCIKWNQEIGQMSDMINIPGSYRVEVSGWDLDSNFFVEKTNLVWSQNGEKKVRLRHALTEGAIIFVRLLIEVSTVNSVPVAYQVKDMQGMDCDGQCEILLTQLHPRVRESIAGKSASYK